MRPCAPVAHDLDAVERRRLLARDAAGEPDDAEPERFRGDGGPARAWVARELRGGDEQQARHYGFVARTPSWWPKRRRIGSFTERGMRSVIGSRIRRGRGSSSASCPYGLIQTSRRPAPASLRRSSSTVKWRAIRPLRLACARAFEVQAEPAGDRQEPLEAAVDEEEERAAVVDHQHDLPAGPRHAHELGERAVHVARVVDHAPREHEVEARVGERKPLRIRLSHVRLEPEGGEPASRRLDGPVGQVDARDVGAGLREQLRRDPAADPDVEHVLAAERVEVDEEREGLPARVGGQAHVPRVEDATVDLAEELLRAFVVRDRVVDVVRHRVPVPPVADLLLRRHGR